MEKSVSHTPSFNSNALNFKRQKTLICSSFVATQVKPTYANQLAFVHAQYAHNSHVFY